MPSTLLPLPGDSTLVADEGNARFMIIGPNLKVHRSMSTQRPGLVYSPWPRATDRQGRLPGRGEPRRPGSVGTLPTTPLVDRSPGRPHLLLNN
jgi:hypothetical protein